MSNAGDPGSIPVLGRYPGAGHGQPLLPGESPWTEEPGGLQSMGLQRVEHDWVTKHTVKMGSVDLSSGHGGHEVYLGCWWGGVQEIDGHNGPRIHIEGWSQRYMFRSQEINDNSSCRSAWDIINRHQTHRRGSKAEPWRTQHSKRAERQGWACKGGTDGCG